MTMVMILTKTDNRKGVVESEDNEEEGTDIDIISTTNDEGFTPLDVAIINNNVRAAAELIVGGANINVSVILWSKMPFKIMKMEFFAGKP